MNNKKRFVIIHNHLFKNAGTTIDWALANNFQSNFVDHREDNYMSMGATYLGSFIEQNPSVCAISTHSLALPLPLFDKISLIKLMMFRHPLERATSVYNFERNRATSNNPGPVHARKLDIKDYIEWRMKPEIYGTIRNFHMIKSLPPRPIDQNIFSDYEISQAKKFLNSVELLGVVEHFDECMVLFEETLRPIFPSIDLSYIRQNIGQKINENSLDRIDNLRDKIGNKVFNLFADKNRLDMILYDWVCSLVTIRIQLINNFTYKLYTFRKRCEARKCTNIE